MNKILKKWFLFTYICFIPYFQWHGLSREEQAKYYDQARKERQLHMQMYPGWSARDNYAQSKKKKRKREAESSNYNFYYF